MTSKVTFGASALGNAILGVQVDNFWPQISPIFPTGASHYNENQSQYAVRSPNQTYVSITSHLGGHRRVSGELLNDSWTTYLISVHF